MCHSGTRLLSAILYVSSIEHVPQIVSIIKEDPWVAPICMLITIFLGFVNSWVGRCHRIIWVTMPRYEISTRCQSFLVTYPLYVSIQILWKRLRKNQA
jgi:hypothetical protein